MAPPLFPYGSFIPCESTRHWAILAGSPELWRCLTSLPLFLLQQPIHLYYIYIYILRASLFISLMIFHAGARKDHDDQAQRRAIVLDPRCGNDPRPSIKRVPAGRDETKRGHGVWRTRDVERLGGGEGLIECRPKRGSIVLYPPWLLSAGRTYAPLRENEIKKKEKSHCQMKKKGTALGGRFLWLVMISRAPEAFFVKSKI